MTKSDPETQNSFGAAAYGGNKWRERENIHAGELGKLWSGYRITNEYAPLEAVLMHRPDIELAASAKDAEKALMLAPLDITLAQEQHDGISNCYRQNGITVHLVDPREPARPNQMFCADLCAMTPQGAILARPAGQVRAGEEIQVARRLADLEIPILRTLTGNAVFEGADMMWLDAQTALIGRGHRTNQAAIEQISTTLAGIDCTVIPVDLPFGTMHFMGMMRIADKDLAFCWPRRTPFAAVDALRNHGYEVAFPPLSDDPQSYRAMNFVTLGPRKILLAAGNIGCLSSILSRKTDPS